MTSRPESPMKSEKRPLSAMKKHGQPAKPRRRVRFDLSNLKSALEDMSKRVQPSEMVLASRLYLIGTKRRHSADCSSRSHNGPKLVKNENRRISSSTSSRSNVQVVSNEHGMFSVVKGPDFIFTQRIKAYKLQGDDKRKTSVAVQVQPHPSTSTKSAPPPRSLAKLVQQKREQSDLLRDFNNGKVSKELRSSRIDVRSLPVPADLLQWRLEQLYVEQQIEKLAISSGH